MQSSSPNRSIFGSLSDIKRCRNDCNGNLGKRVRNCDELNYGISGTGQDGRRNPGVDDLQLLDANRECGLPDLKSLDCNALAN